MNVAIFGAAFAAMLAMMLFGLPIAVAMALVGIVGGIAAYGVPFMDSIAPVVWGVQNENLLTSIPLFVLLGELLLRSGIADRMYRPPVMAMSLYSKEGMPLWDKYSTHAIAHCIQVYSRYSFAYPYPVAYSVLGGLGGGMEYPMICFNGPRPEEDGTYTKRQKYGLIGVVINDLRNPFFTQWLFDFNTDTLQYHVQDKISMGDLTINIGWKGFQVNNEADPRVQGSLAAGKIKSRDWFQPHAGVAARQLAARAPARA